MKLALVTGVGHKGQVGEAVAAKLASDGFELILVDRTPDDVGARAAEIRRTGGKATAYSCDLTDPAAVTRLFETVALQHGPTLHACVHLAGGFASTGPVAETDPTAWDKQLNINLRTAFLVARGAIPPLRGAHGALVFFSSESALPGAKLSRVAAYAVAKTGIVTLATAISQEERDSGVRANVVAPAAIRTAANLQAMGADARYVELPEVAAAVSYLCSDESRPVTGQVLHLGAA